MSSRSLAFIAFIAFSLASLAGGYLARERGWVREEASRTLHYWTIVALWSAAGLFGIWKLPPALTNLWVVALEPLLVALPALAAIPISRWLKAPPKQAGVLVVASGLSNLGFTLGGYLCYTLVDDPVLLPTMEEAATPEAVGDAALAYAIAQVSMMTVMSILLLFPLARHYGGQRGDDESLGRLIYHSFVDWRAMMLYCAGAGALLAYLRVPYPTLVDRWYLMDILFYAGAFTAYFGIGLRLHVGPTVRNVRFHTALAAVKFLLLPLLTLGLLALANASGVAPPPLAEQVMLVLSVMPTAIQTVIIPNLFHLDARLASGMWLVNTLVFVALPLPVLLWWLI
jgi:predicted permease